MRDGETLAELLDQRFSLFVPVNVREYVLAEIQEYFLIDIFLGESPNKLWKKVINRFRIFLVELVEEQLYHVLNSSIKDTKKD